MKKVAMILSILVLFIANSFAQWKVNNYVDSFGDSTSQKYIQLFAPEKGAFSNSATSGSELIVAIALEPSKSNEIPTVNIRLFEYGRGPEVGLGDGEIATLTVKLPNGTVETYNLIGSKTLYVSKKKHNEALVNHLLNGEELKCYVRVSNIHYSMESKYVFTIPAVENFKEVYAKL